MTKRHESGNLRGVRNLNDGSGDDSQLQTLIERAALLLSRAECTVALTGAGISTPSGIPDFRSPVLGLWNQVDPDVASIDTFQQRPEVFFNWIRPLALAVFKAIPNPAHDALALMEENGLLKSVITQNVDGLHQQAGSQRVHEVHGHIREATCVRCYQTVPTEALVDSFVNGNDVPQCSCGGTLKPNVVLFGEQLPARALMAAQQDTNACDLLLVAGSSLEIAPVSNLPLMAVSRGSRLIIINFEPTPFDHLADLVIHENVAEVLPRIADLAVGVSERQL